MVASGVEKSVHEGGELAWRRGEVRLGSHSRRGSGGVEGNNTPGRRPVASEFPVLMLVNLLINVSLTVPVGGWSACAKRGERRPADSHQGNLSVGFPTEQNDQAGRSAAERASRGHGGEGRGEGGSGRSPFVARLANLEEGRCQ